MISTAHPQSGTGTVVSSGMDHTANAQDCPTPVARAVMQQGWYDLCSLHYRYDPGVVARVLPPGPPTDPDVRD